VVESPLELPNPKRAVLGAEIDEAVPQRLELGPGPRVTLVPVADATSVIEVIEVLNEICEDCERLRPEVVQLEVVLSSRQELMEKTVSTALREVLADKR